MGFELINIYKIGTLIPLKFKWKSMDKKLSFVFFPYTTEDVVFTSILILIFSIILANLLAVISAFFYSTILFIGIIIATVCFIYPFHIYYSHKLMEYTEEMLRAILHLSTYIQMGTSMEYAFIQTEKNLSGILKVQLNDINTMLKRKKVTDIGEAINKYVKIWNDVNPYFLKSLRLLQTAAFSEEKDKEKLIAETIETLLMNYNVIGKRSTEKLSKNTKMLISVGILIPIMSLLLLPLVSVFFPAIVKPSLIAFVYIILFPSIVLISAMSFTTQRIQVDTIRIKDSIEYKRMPKVYMIIAFGIFVLFSIPTFLIINNIMHGLGTDIDNFKFMVMGWFLGAGIMLGTFFYTYMYERKYRKLWNEIRDIETDLPFILQSFSTYFTLNLPFEKVIDGVVDDYESLGFKKHSVVKYFKLMQRMIATTKENVHDIISKHAKKIIPSSKVRAIINQVVAFEDISQESVSKASKMIRQQVINTYKLDDYIKTLLSDSVGLISMTITMLAPLLCASAVIMTYAIVKSILFITKQLELISSVFGGSGISLKLIDVSKVVPPIFIEIIVGVYLVETILILSLFQTQISIGTDYYQTTKTLRSNLIGFIIYTLLLFGGYFFINVVLFKGILG